MHAGGDPFNIDAKAFVRIPKKNKTSPEMEFLDIYLTKDSSLSTRGF
jgi:hypothetical protein